MPRNQFPLEIDGIMRQPFESRLGYQIVVLDADATAQIVTIEARLDRNHISDLQRVVPVRIQSGRFVAGQTNPVAKVVEGNATRCGRQAF